MVDRYLISNTYEEQFKGLSVTKQLKSIKNKYTIFTYNMFIGYHYNQHVYIIITSFKTHNHNSSVPNGALTSLKDYFYP